MSSIDGGELYLEIPGATEEQLIRGIRAAKAAFLASGVSYEDEFTAYFDRDGLDDMDQLDDMTDEMANCAAIVDYAWRAGIVAACGDGRGSGGNFGLWEVCRDSAKRQAEFAVLLPPEN